MADGNQLKLYAPAGAAMLLQAEVDLPLIWMAPNPYLSLVTTTQRWLAAING
jgi:hypothetical protein